MQNTIEQNSANKRGVALKAVLLFAFMCLFAVICGQTIHKFTGIYNTFGDSDALNVNLRLMSHTETLADNKKAYVRIGGKPIGISVNAGGLIMTGETEVVTENGSVFPAKDKGLEIGDVILAVNGTDVNSVYQLKKLLENPNLNSVVLSVNRSGNIFDVSITPAIDKLSGQKKLGIMLKEDVGGVGTLTFVTQDGRFGALGHYIIDGDSGLSDELNYGNIFSTTVTDVIRGERGKAGGLVAEVNRLSTPIGGICRNTNIGIYGQYTAEYNGELYKIASKGEAKPGAAQVFTTIDGDEPKFYDIDIVKVVSQSDAAEKGMVIAVRDKELLEKTGGIVQGMSGSPIVQNGVLIGAVTHVFVQDPTRGYAVHSRFMYDYAMTARTSALYGQVAA